MQQTGLQSRNASNSRRELLHRKESESQVKHLAPLHASELQASSRNKTQPSESPGDKKQAYLGVDQAKEKVAGFVSKPTQPFTNQSSSAAFYKGSSQESPQLAKDIRNLPRPNDFGQQEQQSKSAHITLLQNEYSQLLQKYVEMKRDFEAKVFEAKDLAESLQRVREKENELLEGLNDARSNYNRLLEEYRQMEKEVERLTEEREDFRLMAKKAKESDSQLKTDRELSAINAQLNDKDKKIVELLDTITRLETKIRSRDRETNQYQHVSEVVKAQTDRIRELEGKLDLAEAATQDAKEANKRFMQEQASSERRERARLSSVEQSFQEERAALEHRSVGRVDPARNHEIQRQTQARARFAQRKAPGRRRELHPRKKSDAPAAAGVELPGKGKANRH